MAKVGVSELRNLVEKILAMDKKELIEYIAIVYREKSIELRINLENYNIKDLREFIGIQLHKEVRNELCNSDAAMLVSSTKPFEETLQY